jgi:Sushi repeat (SCR repeat)
MKSIHLPDAGCVSIKSGQHFEFSLEEKRRLYAIEITTDGTSLNKNDKLEGIEATAQFETVKVDEIKKSSDSTFRFLLHKDGLSKRYEQLTFTPQTDVTVCGVKLFLYYDQCGKPTHPLNGQVSLSYDNDTATYRCNVGYYVTGTSSRSAKRVCFQGEWTNPVPTCKFMPFYFMHQKCTKNIIAQVPLGVIWR